MKRWEHCCLIQAAMELMVAYMAMAAQKEREQKHVDDEEVAQSRWSQWRRGGLIGAAALTGGAILAITGGSRHMITTLPFLFFLCSMAL
jgi:hypothetical protein